MGQLRFPLWEPFVLEPTGPHEGTNYRDAQQDGGANLLPRCSELIITSTLRVVQSQCTTDGQQKPACPFECSVDVNSLHFQDVISRFSSGSRFILKAQLLQFGKGHPNFPPINTQ